MEIDWLKLEKASMPMRLAWPFMAFLAVCLPPAMPAHVASRLGNGSFEKWEKSKPIGWSWWRRDGVPPERDNPTPVGIEPADGEAYTGERCIRLWKRSPIERERYGMLGQRVRGLPAGATIRYRAMLKGKGVEQVWVGDWHTRVRPPDGDLDWRQFSGRVKLAEGQTEYVFRFGVEGKTEALWVDDVHVWLDGHSRREGKEHLFIRRMQPWARPGVSTIRRTKQFPETETGFQVVVRNPEPQTQVFVLNWTLCDVLGAPLASDRVRMSLESLAQKRITVPVELGERRVAAILATLTDTEGKELANGLDFVTAPPASLEPIKLSRRFGACAFPFAWSAEANRLILDQMAAGGYGDWRYSQMDRSFDSRNRKLNPEAYKWFFTEAGARGMTILPILGYGPNSGT